MELYLTASGASEKPKATQTAIILHCAGVQVQEVHEHFIYEVGEDKFDPKFLLDKLAGYCAPKTNEVVESHRFWNMCYRTPFDTFLTELRSRAKLCNFGDANMTNRMIRDKIVFSATGKMQELLLREKTLDLQKTIDICRAHELTSKTTKEMSAAQVDKVTQRETKEKNAQHAQVEGGGQNRWTDREEPRYIRDCGYCGRSHEAVKTKCLAWGKVCKKCNGRNHFRVKCHSSASLHAVESREREMTQHEDMTSKFMGAMTSSKRGRVTALMQVNENDIRFQLDSGADVNIICSRFVKKGQILPTQQTLTMWNGSSFKPIGEAVIDVINPKTHSCVPVRFTVVDDNLTCLLGVETIQELGLLTINRSAFIGEVTGPATGPALGDLGEAKLTLRPGARPRVLPCRRIPFALQDEVRQQVDQLVERGVLVKVEEPTEWVSQMAVTRKESDGSLRICIDPQPLNEALMREHFKMPTLDDVLPQLYNAKVFTKLDVKEAFWHVRLDEESSRLTTMITPFGRYRWSRLPFGLSVSSEIFQKRLTEALGGLSGVICVADDIVVVGRGDTKTAAETEHAKNLCGLQQRCKEKNIRLNEKKAAVRKEEITFMGHRISAEGVKPDRAKIAAILDMPAPTDVQGVRRLCGMIQYLAKFMPNLASDLEPIRALTKKDSEWNWSPECEQALKAVKQQVTNTPVLAFFDPREELVLQVDSSKDGLGAAILQNGRPLEYASRALTQAERRWAQIEKETLALVFGLERFDQYTYGRPIRVQNDHKPLAAILKKPLSQASRRIQALMMRLHRYDVTFQYVQGTQLFIADTLSRAYLPDPGDDICVLEIHALADVADKTRDEVRDATEKDRGLQTLLRVIDEGWPEKKCDVPENIRMYFDVRDTLSQHEGIILKGDRILIPFSLRADMTKRLHAAHLGYDSMLRRARELMYWPGMAQDIKQMADNCEACQRMKPNNQKEPLMQHEDGRAPWKKIGTDLFEIRGRQYLVTVDYFSYYIEVDYLKSTTTRDVINKLQGHFARYGVPAEIVSDQGPQYTAAEFKRMTEEWGIIHTMSSPGHHQSNGKAEAAVKTVKHMMYKCLEKDSNQYEALLELRNTPRQDTGLSPAQMMFGRQIRSRLPMINTKPVGQRQTQKAIKKRRNRQKTVKSSYDKRAKELIPLHAGQPVFFQHVPGQQWKKGVIRRRDDERSYTVEGDNGGVYERNRVHIRPTSIHSKPWADRALEPLLDAPKDPPPAHPQATAPEAARPAMTAAAEGGQECNDGLIQPPEFLVTTPRPQRERKKPRWLEDYETNF